MQDCNSGSQAREGHAPLPHVFARAVLVARLTTFVALQEQELARALIGINLGRKWRGVGELQRDMPFPARLERGDVHNDPTACVSALAKADHKYVFGDAEILDRAGKCKAVGRDHADIGLAVDEAVPVEILRIDHRAVYIGEDLELGCHPRVVAVTRQPVADYPFATLRLDERLDHAFVLRLVADPLVGKNRHAATIPEPRHGGKRPENLIRSLARQQRRVAACRGRVDAHHAFGGKSLDVMRSACLGAGTR